MFDNPFAAKLRVTKSPRVEFYQDAKKEYRWRLFYSSDEVAASSEGYKNKQDAIDNFLKIEQHIKWLRENGKIS
jgi:uncharacterized protein YegP (UPF0339 family)